MEKEAYENLLHEFEQGTCVLILGPEFFLIENDDETLIQNLRDIIYSKREKLKNKPYLSEDGFFYVNKTSTHRNTILFDIQDYYRNQAIPDYYKILSSLPFKLVINLSPDDYLSKALLNDNRSHEFLFYKNGLYKRTYDTTSDRFINSQVSEIEKLPTPSIDHPWVFNFLGIYEDKESMVFTFDALFEFLYSVFPISNIPNKLKLEIQNSSTFLFMGFDYNKWYLKIIFFILHKICESTGVLKSAVFNYNEDTHQGAVNFFQSQFNINFHRESTISFLNALSADCKIKVGKQPTPPEASKECSKILYLASHPSNQMHIRSDREYKIIEECLQKKRFRNKFMLAMKSITYKEMLATIDQHCPNVLVLSMHGTKELGILFDNNDGEDQPLSADEFIKDIAVLNRNPKSGIQCIIFSACHSSEFARRLSEYIPVVIGVEGLIQQEAMFEFCEGFFESFFNSGDLESAYQMGVRYVERKREFGIYEDKIKCFSKNGVLAKLNTMQISV